MGINYQRAGELVLEAQQAMQCHESKRLNESAAKLLDALDGSIRWDWRYNATYWAMDVATARGLPSPDDAARARTGVLSPGWHRSCLSVRRRQPRLAQRRSIVSSSGGMPSRSIGGKHFTDVLGPLYRFLLKQVGRPWDAVYSEFARNLPKTSLQNRHIYTHLWQFVEKHVVIIDGVACYSAGRAHGVPIRSAGRYAQLYVNPVTGLLCKAKKGRSRYGYRWPPPEPFQRGIKVYPGVQYHKVKGVWY